MDLFIDTSIELEKISAAEVTLPDDPNEWPTEILQELYKQVPYIADFMPDIVMDRVDAEQRFGFGHVEVTNKTEIQSPPGSPMMNAAGVRNARIPIIVKEGKLQPFDVLVTSDSKMLPLTERRLRQSLFRPQLFDVTSRTPGDQSMISQLYPPYRQNYGFGGGGAVMTAGMGKEGEAAPKADAVGSAIPLETSKAAPGMVVKAAGGANMAGPMMASYVGGISDPKRLAGVARPLMATGAKQIASGATGMGQKMVQLGNLAAQKATKLGSILEAILPTIDPVDFARFVDTVTQPNVKAAYAANKDATNPAVKELSKFEEKNLKERGEKLAQAVHPTVVQIVRHHEHGYVVKTANHGMWQPLERALDRGQLAELVGFDGVLEIDKHGAATMADDAAIGSDQPEADRPELIKDYGIYRVQTDDGKELLGFCFPNLIDLSGESLPMTLFTNGSESAVQGEIAGIRVASGASLMESHPRGHGVFYQVLPNGSAQATVPLTIGANISGMEEGASSMTAETMDGGQVQVSIQPGITRVCMADEGTVVIPDTFRWMPLDQTQAVALVGDPDAFQKEAMPKAVGRVWLRSSGEGSFAVSGEPVEKMASDETSFLDVDQVMFLLGGLGVTPQYATQKLGEAIHFQMPIEVPVSRFIDPAAGVQQEMAEKAAEVMKRLPNLRQDLVKEAADIPDPSAVDSVLSLGFINPENMITFIGYLPQLDETQNKLCELLIASRLGVREVSSTALERAIRGLEDTIEGLNLIAFNKNN